MDFVTLVYSGFDSPKCNLGSVACLQDVGNRQLVIVGESLGGGVALAACLQLQKSEKPEIRPRGLILSAPFLQSNVPFGASKSFATAVQALPFKTVNLPTMFLPPIRGAF